MLNEDTLRLIMAIAEYRHWAQGRPKNQGRDTAVGQAQILFAFLSFALPRNLRWQEMFSEATVQNFQDYTQIKGLAQALSGLGTFLYAQGRIDQPIKIKKTPEDLPPFYEQYLRQLDEVRAFSASYVHTVRRVLLDFHAFLVERHLDLLQVKIDELDAFLTTFQVAENTRNVYRYCLRGFLKYLYSDQQVLKRELATMLVAPPRFAPIQVPRFLRPEQIQRLFDSLTLKSRSEIRTAAMTNLAFFLGLRPVEISRMRLDDLSFEKGELALRDTKTNHPMTLPVPERTLKITGLYLQRVRPPSAFREVFLALCFPYQPVGANIVGASIREAMKKAGLASSPYWLRHSYAQNLLQQGASVYEIKEMLGHQSLQSSQRYLHIDIERMRTVLFDETL